MSDLSAPVPPIFVAEALDCARRAGLDGRAIARRAVSCPRQDSMSIEDYGRFWFALAQEIGDEMLGMAAYPMRPGSFALLCHALLGTATLGQALRRALWGLGIMLGSPVGTVVIRNGQAHIAFTDRGAPLSAFAYRTLLIVLLGPICWLARRRIPLLHVAFRCDAPAGATAYSRFFGTPVQFGDTQTRVAIDAACLSLPVTRTEAALKRYLNAAPGNLLVGYRGADDPAGRVRAVLTERAAQDWPDFEAVADLLNMAPGTLRRHLRDQGTTFRDLKAELRQSQAKALLKEGDLSVAQIADRLGYAEPSAFFRAFHVWTGTSPAQYQGNARSD